MSKLAAIDRKIFSGSDHPLDEKDDIYSWFEERIDHFITHIDSDDRCFFSGLEVMLAMLWRLSSYFDNYVIKREKVEDWQIRALGSFDRFTAIRGDADKVAEWRNNINSRVSGSNYHSSNWLQSCGVKGLKSCFASSSWRGIFSNGWTLRSCKVLCSVPGSASCLWRMATMR